MDNCPCGMGGEDFGGSIACTKDGKLFLQGWALVDNTTDSDWNDTTNGNLVKIWRQATDVCQQKKEWDETSFGSPPWQGVRQGNKLVGGHAEYCFLTAPMELH